MQDLSNIVKIWGIICKLWLVSVFKHCSSYTKVNLSLTVFRAFVTLGTMCVYRCKTVAANQKPTSVSYAQTTVAMLVYVRCARLTYIFPLIIPVMVGNRSYFNKCP